MANTGHATYVWPYYAYITVQYFKLATRYHGSMEEAHKPKFTWNIGGQ